VDPISKQTRTAFREHLVSTTLGYITDLFDSADVPRGTASSRISGARRGLVEEYYAGIDWTSPIDLRKIINAYEQVLNRAQEFQSDPYYEKELKKLTALLHRDGYVFEDTRLIPLAGIDLKALEAAHTGVDRASLRDHIRRIEQNVDADPAQAIGSAKELVETVAKHVLVQFGEDPEQHGNVPQLVKHSMKLLDLSLENLPQAKKGAESIRQILAGLGQIVGGTAELRNLYGTGHGRTHSGGLQARHARLVVGAAGTLVRFPLDTLDARNRPKP
jgi:hypothetical protein